MNHQRSLTTSWALAVSLLASIGSSATAQAQSVASRIDGVTNGKIRLNYAAGQGVCGNGPTWFRSRDGRSGTFYGSWNGSSESQREIETTCERGPVRVVIVREDGDTKAIRMYVGGRWKADTGITDLGTVSGVDAGAWFLRQAERGPVKVARSALQAAILTDSVQASQVLLRIARDDSRPQDVRNAAVNWLGEVVGERVSATLDSIAYEAGDRDIRRTAIHTLARRPKEEAVPALQKMAETLPDRELRRTAVMALAQTRDTQAIAWLERRLQSR